MIFIPKIDSQKEIELEQLLLLSLLLLSCIVVLVREVANIQISNSSASYQCFLMTHLSSDINIDNIRERSLLPSKLDLRDTSIFSIFLQKHTMNV